MKQTRKGNQWHFGMKAHIGVGAVTGLTHSVAATSANVADVTMAGHLVRDDDERVYGDAGYLGMWKYLDEERLPVGLKVSIDGIKRARPAQFI